MTTTPILLQLLTQIAVRLASGKKEVKK